MIMRVSTKLYKKQKKKQNLIIDAFCSWFSL